MFIILLNSSFFYSHDRIYTEIVFSRTDFFVYLRRTCRLELYCCCQYKRNRYPLTVGIYPNRNTRGKNFFQYFSSKKVFHLQFIVEGLFERRETQ